MNEHALNTPGEPVSVTLNVPAQFAYLRVVRQSVMDMCARTGLSEFDAAQLEMAVDEACSNVIEHSYGETPDAESGQPDADIKINLIQQKDRIVVEIYDQGKGFDQQSKPPVPPEEYIKGKRERGLGLFIISRFVDEVAYERGTPAGNYLRLVKHI